MAGGGDAAKPKKWTCPPRGRLGPRPQRTGAASKANWCDSEYPTGCSRDLRRSPRRQEDGRLRNYTLLDLSSDPCGGRTRYRLPAKSVRVDVRWARCYRRRGVHGGWVAGNGPDDCLESYSLPRP